MSVCKTNGKSSSTLTTNTLKTNNIYSEIHVGSSVGLKRENNV